MALERLILTAKNANLSSRNGRAILVWVIKADLSDELRICHQALHTLVLLLVLVSIRIASILIRIVFEIVVD